ncbi:MAG TPA: hypothetical protein VHM72_07335 [Solirubrobacteraceae bacterium]|jgi:hypothetical protein|nr:hypothetical protein [Solirubrobacteraceae bacterium]
MDDRERQLEIEGAQRQRVGMLAIAAGSLYLIGQLLILVLISSKEPATGLLQGLAPALHGAKEAVVDPRVIDERYLDKHAVENVIAWLVGAAGLALMAWPLRYLRDAEVARGGKPSRLMPVLIKVAPPTVAAASVVLAVSDSIGAHKLVTHAVQNTAAYDAATGGAFRGVLDILYLLGYLAIAVIFVLVALRAMRVGLLTRPLGILGIVGGVLFIIPIVPLPLIQFLFLVGFGMLLLGVGGMVRPPAWAAGEAIPWVKPGQQSASAARGGRRGNSQPATLAPAPTPPPAPSPAASKKRKRRRG